MLSANLAASTKSFNVTGLVLRISAFKCGWTLLINEGRSWFSVKLSGRAKCCIFCYKVNDRFVGQLFGRVNCIKKVKMILFSEPRLKTLTKRLPKR